MRASVERVAVSALKLPTEREPESDGTETWDATTMVVVECASEGLTGIAARFRVRRADAPA